MPEYTAEQCRIIVAGLASGKRPGHRPMSDAEFLALYDPPSRIETVLSAIAKDIKALLEAPEGRPQRAPAWREYQPQKGTNQPSGPVAIP